MYIRIVLSRLGEAVGHGHLKIPGIAEAGPRGSRGQVVRGQEAPGDFFEPNPPTAASQPEKPPVTNYYIRITFALFPTVSLQETSAFAGLIPDG